MSEAREPTEPNEVAGLYGLRPEDFTKARDDLAKRLRTEGERESAEAVRRLRKPTVSAWAVNQVVRSAPKTVDALLQAGGDLGKAQQTALRGGGRAALQAVTAHRRDLVGSLVESARRMLEDEGRSAVGPVLGEVADTFLAMATDPEGAGLVRRGTLDRPLTAPSGFGDLGFDLSDTSPEPTRRATPKVDDRTAKRREKTVRRLEGLVTKAEEAEATAARLVDEAKDAERTATRARTAADRAVRGARQARERADRAAAQADGS